MKKTIPVFEEMDEDLRERLIQAHVGNNPLDKAHAKLMQSITSISCCGLQCISGPPPATNTPEDLFIQIEIDGQTYPIPAAYALCSSCGAKYHPFTRERIIERSPSPTA